MKKRIIIFTILAIIISQISFGNEIGSITPLATLAQQAESTEAMEATTLEEASEMMSESEDNDVMDNTEKIRAEQEIMAIYKKRIITGSVLSAVGITAAVVGTVISTSGDPLDINPKIGGYLLSAVGGGVLGGGAYLIFTSIPPYNNAKSKVAMYQNMESSR